jgi:hypothetical protein
VIFASDRDGAQSLSQPADGSGEAKRLTVPNRVAHIPESVSPNGEVLLFAQLSDGGKTEWIYGFADGTISPFPEVHSPAISRSGPRCQSEVVGGVPTRACTFGSGTTRQSVRYELSVSRRSLSTAGMRARSVCRGRGHQAAV